MWQQSFTVESTARAGLTRLCSHTNSLALCTAAASLASAAPVYAATYATFDPPGGIGTAPSTNNDAVAGSDFGNNGYHGYLGAPDGSFAVVVITGEYEDSNQVFHGFVRTPKGRFPSESRRAALAERQAG